MSLSRNSPVLPLLFLLGAILVPACAQEEEPVPAEPADEETSDLWGEVQQLYEKAKEAGEQVPETTMDWIRQDLKRIGDWEYRIVSLSGSSEQIEQELNKLGQERWDCFWVQPEDQRIRFFLKRPSRSYLSSMPVSSLMKLLPIGGSGDSSE